MKKYLIDTNIFIDHLKGKKAAKETLKSLSEAGEVYYSVVTRIELLACIREKETEDVENLLEIYKEKDVNREIGERAGRYMHEFFKSHALNIGDAIIAATADYLDAELITLNIKHFPMKDLKIKKPY
ncbi:MAG: type II toxin-antitoxin system VapC family toxin [Tepidanaerobacteraceae bacterium]|jgi:predicted nucleic acid-binding protein|nr:type II toxin-antitoxin system VapC family toxin [Tepidanaerobacteraceae bacterium]